ncbi:MAG: CotH kinase family protein, partial [Bacteroidales bacterium]|nr:CotH kinase family protein [Bacteroidales bacterium]
TNLIDIDNYIDYQILQIFIMNTDQPGKNVFYWRPKNGKWQWLLYDLDDCLNFGDHNNYNKNGLIFCSGLNSINSANINPKSSFPIWANNTPKETLLFRKLLKNINFKNKFINRFADLLNSAFEPDVLEKKLNTYYSVIYKYMPEQYQRWQKPDPLIFENNYNLILEFIKNRKDIQTKQILDFFKINKTITINLQINEPKYGYIKINTLNINDTLLIKNKNQDTWEGLYFYNIPIEIEAIPYSGYFFERWELDTNSNNPKILFLSTSNLKIKAVFALNNNS